MFPANRVVAVLTPFFSIVSAAASAWALKHLPGLPVPSTAELVAGETTAALGAAGAALKWLHGHQKYEEDIRWAEHQAQVTAAEAAKLDPGVQAYLEELVKAEVAKVKPVAQLVSDAEEFAHQPPVTVADSPRPATAVQPDPVPAPVAAQPAPVAAAAQPVQGA